MADGDLTLKLDDETVERLRAAADAVGRTVQDYAAGLISEGLEVDWAEDLARIAEYDRTGESISVEEALDHFDRELEKRLAERRGPGSSACRCGLAATSLA